MVEPKISKIQEEEVEKNKAISESLFFHFSENINALQQKIVFDIGDILTSTLEESDLQLELDDTWIIADGRNIEGSELGNLLNIAFAPDFRGKFLRQKNEIEALLFSGSSENVAHFHNQMVGTSQSFDGAFLSTRMETFKIDTSSSFIKLIRARYTPKASVAEPNAGETRDSGASTPQTGSEFRPKNVALYIYIKINI